MRVVVLLEFDAVAVSPSAGQVCGWLLLNCDCFGIKCAVLPVRGPVLASPREANVLATRICSRHRRLEDIVRILGQSTALILTECEIKNLATPDLPLQNKKFRDH